MRLSRALTAPLLAGLVVTALVVAGCGSSSSSPTPPPGPAMDHTNIVLKDRMGNPLTATSTEPYSPRQTCGACHDVDSIANGYHFQQGRTDENGNIQTATDFFGAAIDISGDWIVAGSPGDDDSGEKSGSAHLFMWDGATWRSVKLCAPDGELYDQFGDGAAVSGSRVVVGAWSDDDNGSAAGAAYVFQF